MTTDKQREEFHAELQAEIAEEKQALIAKIDKIQNIFQLWLLENFLDGLLDED